MMDDAVILSHICLGRTERIFSRLSQHRETWWHTGDFYLRAKMDLSEQKNFCPFLPGIVIMVECNGDMFNRIIINVESFRCSNLSGHPNTFHRPCCSILHSLKASDLTSEVMFWLLIS